MSDSETIDDNFLWSNLPPEIITDVLSRLPVKSLCRFKCVSPSWNSLISSPQFVKTHLKRTNTNNYPQKAILFSGSHELFSVDFADPNPTAIKIAKELDSPSFNRMGEWFRSLSSCNGLVLVSDEGNVNFLLNPSTGEYKELPDSPFCEQSSLNVIFTPGLGYDSSTDDYKVVMFFFIEPTCANTTARGVYTVVVYSLKSDAWRTIPDFHYAPVGRHRGVCSNEHLHWLCWRTGGLDYSKVILAFDLANEVFEEIQLPAACNDYNFRVHDMVVLEGCLCLLIWSEGVPIDVWMMMEYGVRESWTRFTIANPAKSTVGVLCLSAQDELVLRRKNLRMSLSGRVVDEFDGEKLVLYNPRQGTRRDMAISGIPTRYIVGDNYMETLVSPNHGERIRRQGEASSG